MNTQNSKTSEPHRFKLDLTDKLNLKNSNKNMALANLNIYYTWKNIKSEYNNNKFKISASTWNDTFDLPGGSYSIQDYLEFIVKKDDTLTENPPIQIYPNKIKNRIVFKKKTGYKLEYKNKNSENVPKLESVEVVLLHCNLVKNDYQHIKSFI